tara:strand:- start:1073 stop:1648 length:576 start_codon:yes stop_codon:yes gene_type:complete
MQFSGISVIVNGDLDEKGYRGDFDVVMYVVYHEGREYVFTDLDIKPPPPRVRLHRIEEFPNHFPDDMVFVGHNLPKDMMNDGMCFDLMREVKALSAKVLQNEGKRYSLKDICRWNKANDYIDVFATQIKKYIAQRKGDHYKLVAWGVGEAKKCDEAYRKIRKSGRVRFYDQNTGRLASAEARWHLLGGEEE